MTASRDEQRPTGSINAPLVIGFVLTGFWCLGFVVYSLANYGAIVTSTPNNIGDFMAGSFAPLAFLWLLVATLLQRHELELQRKELIETRRQMERSIRANLDQSLVRQRNDINAAFINHSIRGPFATILKVADVDLSRFNAKVGILMNQINLLEDVYQGRDILGEEKFRSHENWATEIVKPWILSDPQLEAVMGLIFVTNDMMDKTFVVWLKNLIAIREES